MLKNKHRHALSILLLLFAIHSSATPADTLKIKKDSTLVSYFFNDFEKFGNLRLHSLDTAITGYQNYDPLLLQSAFHETQGNIGQASRNLIPYPFLTNSGFDYGIHTFDGYLYQNDSVNTIRCSKPLQNSGMNKAPKRKPSSEPYSVAIFTEA